MSSLRHIEATRRNSLRSTGPRTPEGKSISRMNALKSGINTKVQVIPGEDPADLQAMADGCSREWAPKTYLERFLVDSLVRADWLLQRLSRALTQLQRLRQGLDDDGPELDPLPRECEASDAASPAAPPPEKPAPSAPAPAAERRNEANSTAHASMEAFCFRKPR